MTVLAYIKDKKIHSKLYNHRGNPDNDWQMLCKTNLPVMRFDQNNDYVMCKTESHSRTRMKWERIPPERMPKLIPASVAEEMEKDPTYLGMRFDYCPDLEIYSVRHTYVDPDTGLKGIDCRMFDNFCNCLIWAEYD